MSRDPRDDVEVVIPTERLPPGWLASMERAIERIKESAAFKPAFVIPVSVPLSIPLSGGEDVIEINEDNVEEAFRYHAPTADQIPRFQAINDAAKAFAKAVLVSVPRCPARTRALNMIADARMVANSGVALENVE